VWSAATVLACALGLLGRSAASFPPIVFVDTRPSDASDIADAFVREGDPTIYLVTSSPAFQRAQRSQDRCGAFNDLRKLASILVHEEWHVRHGPGERQAYEAQLTALTGLSAGPGHVLYAEVRRSMAVALASSPQPTRWGPIVMASRQAAIRADGLAGFARSGR
jgi:hypothetical protein